MLLPVRFPYPDPSCLLANVPKEQPGLDYFLTLRDRFPEGHLIDDGFRCCTISRIELSGPCEMSERPTPLSGDFLGPSFPLLKARISGSHANEVVEVANIIADPLGYHVFWQFIQERRGETFQTADFGHLPISEIDHAGLWDLNFSF